MIFGLIRLVIWLAGVAVVAYVALGFVGYQVNWSYFEDSKKVCEETLRKCQSDLIKTGIEGAKEKCPWKCIDPKLLIKKDTSKENQPAN